MSAVRVPAGRGIPLLSDIPDRQCRDGRPQRVIGRKQPVIAMPVFSRLRDQIGDPVEELKGRELDDAVGSRLRGLSLPAGPDPGGGPKNDPAPGHHVADASHPRRFREGLPEEPLRDGNTVIYANSQNPTVPPAGDSRRRFFEQMPGW